MWQRTQLPPMGMYVVAEVLVPFRLRERRAREEAEEFRHVVAFVGTDIDIVDRPGLCRKHRHQPRQPHLRVGTDADDTCVIAMISHVAAWWQVAHVAHGRAAAESRSEKVLHRRAAGGRLGRSSPPAHLCTFRPRCVLPSLRRGVAVFLSYNDTLSGYSLAWASAGSQQIAGLLAGYPTFSCCFHISADESVCLPSPARRLGHTSPYWLESVWGEMWVCTESDL